MDGSGGTASLRTVAASWSLAGDKQLLELLQNLHEKIVTKCQETNSDLQEMVNDLDTASISLQNVNNRLMALSNSQFVESRVYDDDVDVATTDTPVKEPPKAAEPTSELSMLRDSLRVLEAYHEPVHILDSDSDSGSDEEEDRMVFKPKDLYAHRPLPYVIGSQQWRSKWHAGLVAEDSDSDSDTSKVNAPSEQYSASDGEDGEDAPPDQPHASQRTISTTSSIESELTIPTVGKPADIAAELARRLGGDVPHIPDPEPESPPVAAAPTKVYRAQEPVQANLFSDEPPPLDLAYESEQSDSDGDVFAELHRQSARPAEHRRGVGHAADQLFGNVPSVYGQKAGFEDDADTRRQPTTNAKQPSPLFEEPQDSELFADKSTVGQKPVHVEPEVSTKKPVGGISLFGNNHGTESIGAAILKRNQRKVSTSDEENEQPQEINRKNDHVENSQVKTEIVSNSNAKMQKDIINDLFSKPNKAKQPIKKVENKSAVKMEKPVNKKVDLFNDDLFDDIDDIFTNVKPLVKESKESVKKSLFDDDDDDLFANIAVSSNKSSSKPESKSKSIFDSNDDLFSEQREEKNEAELNNSISNNGMHSEESDNINNCAAQSKCAPTTTTNTIAKITKIKKTEHERDIQDFDTLNPVQDKTLLKDNKAKSIFDSDSDDDIFSEVKTSNDDISNTRVTSEDVLFLSKDTPALRKIDLNNISKNSEININTKKDNLASDNSLHKQIEKPLDMNKEFTNPQIDINDTNRKLDLDKFDNNKKTEEVLSIRKETTSEVENNTNIYTENKQPPSTNKYDNINQHKEVSGTLSDTNILKTQFRSPSFFDEDDDFDDIFTKTVDNNTSNIIDDKLENNSLQSSSVTNNQNVISDGKFMDVKQSKEVNKTIMINSDVGEFNNKNINFTKTVSDNQIDVSNKTERSLLNNDTLKDSKPLPSDALDYSISEPNESNGQESTEQNLENNIPPSLTKNEPSLPQAPPEPVTAEPDLFNDIFSDIPPEFERPKEPKRSKNINALFDDDSDDEALFFKKNEIVTDEKPDFSFGSQEDRLFNIFHDEPPAMDVDFTQKSKKTPSSGLETQSGESYSETIPPEINIYGQANNESLGKEKKQNESNAFVDPVSENVMDEAKKPVGKLKPMNFNINVNTLLPGASPKKSKTYEQVDGQVISTKTLGRAGNDEESKIVKSVSFEGDPESEVLDNKLSKERAKIQVKRRPSTRRARKEAVRKSGIDFGDDSTDNSSSTDISRNDNFTNNYSGLQTTNKTKQNLEHGNTSNADDINENKSDFKDIGIGNITHHNKVPGASEINPGIERKSQFSNNVETNTAVNLRDNDNTASDEIRKEVSENSNFTTTFNRKPNVKSKVVYILNDEDIFTDAKPIINTSENKQTTSVNAENNPKSKVLNIVDDDDELFKSSTSKHTNIATLGNVYKDAKLKNNDIDNFDSEEDIFKASHSQLGKNIEANTKSGDSKGKIDKLEAKIDELFVKTQTQSNKVSGSLFDELSDEDSELFGNKTSKKTAQISGNSDGIRTLIKKEVKLPKTDVKGSLFGESDDDDLFGVRITKRETSQPVPKPKETSSMPSEPVFADPLSMLGQDDDI